VLSRPAHPYTVGLLGSIPGQGRRGAALAQIPGMAPNMARLPPGCAFAPRCARVGTGCDTDAPATRDLGVGRAVRCHHPVASAPQAPLNEGPSVVIAAPSGGVPAAVPSCSPP
jgi:peptide/nickel transport system ATP-binding protein